MIDETRSSSTAESSLNERLERLESVIESQQETIEKLEDRNETQQETIEKLERDETVTPLEVTADD